MKGILTMKMLGKILGKLSEIAESGQDVLGLIYDLLVKLTSVDGSRWTEEFKLFLRKELEKKAEVVNKILRLLNSKIAIPAVTTPFVVAEHFQVNIGPNAVREWKTGEVKISSVSSNVQSWLGGQTVAVRDGYTLSSHMLTKNAYDKVIRVEVSANHEGDLAGVHALLALQPEGEEGVLLTNGYANIIYITDASGTVRVVYVGWCGGGWHVGAYGLDVAQWEADLQVLARNSNH